MGTVTRDFTVVVTYDGEAFVAVFTTLVDLGSFMRPGREEFTVYVDEEDLSPGVARDLKQTYQERYGEDDQEEATDHAS